MHCCSSLTFEKLITYLSFTIKNNCFTTYFNCFKNNNANNNANNNENNNLDDINDRNSENNSILNSIHNYSFNSAIEKEEKPQCFKCRNNCDDLIIIPCGHGQHCTNCLENWYETNIFCPICKIKTTDVVQCL